MSKIFKIKLDTSRNTDPDFDAVLITFKDSNKQRYYFSNPNLYDTNLLAERLCFDANFSHVPEFDFPFTDSGIFIISKKVKKIFNKFINFNFYEVPVIMFDDTCLENRFLINGTINDSIPINQDYVALRFPKLVSYLDFENSVYIRPEDKVKRNGRGLKKIVLKEPQEGFPAIFRTIEKSTLIIVREDLKISLEAHNVKGCFFEEVHFTSNSKETRINIELEPVKTNNNSNLIKKKKDIPEDLRIISNRPFHSIVFDSKKEKRIFISYYYESGFYQGELVLELNKDEILKFREDSNTFINNQSNLLSKNYTWYLNERNIKEFLKDTRITELRKKWNNRIS